MFKHWMTLLVVLALPPATFAADGAQLYSGTIGRMDVVAELDLSDPGRITGRYFYRKYLHDLRLEGTAQGARLSLREGRHRYGDETRPELRLQRTARGWQGEWLGLQGKRLPVELTPLLVEEPPAGAEPFWYRLYAESPYEFLRLKASPLTPGKRERFMGHDLQWWHEPVSGLAAFEILDGYSQAQLDLINQRLRERLREEVIGYHACRLNAGVGWAEFSQKVTPRLLAADIVSLSIFTSYDCGGAHPDFGDAPLTLSARTGEPLGLEDLLWVGEGSAFRYRELPNRQPDEGSVSFGVFSGYRSRDFAPWLVEQWRRIAPFEVPPPGEEDECDYGDPEMWDFPSWYLGEKGIVFDPLLPRADRACEAPEWSVLPYELVRQHPGRLNLRLPE
ncbi:MAG TPA: hypothetical protein VLF16_14140 [Pseudomonas sp.]|nr:hypothetical protein [Pseudomonas sp.]